MASKGLLSNYNSRTRKPLSGQPSNPMIGFLFPNSQPCVYTLEPACENYNSYPQNSEWTLTSFFLVYIVLLFSLAQMTCDPIQHGKKMSIQQKIEEDSSFTFLL